MCVINTSPDPPRKQRCLPSVLTFGPWWTTVVISGGDQRSGLDPDTETKTKPRVHLQDWSLRLQFLRASCALARGTAKGRSLLGTRPLQTGSAKGPWANYKNVQLVILPFASLQIIRLRFLHRSFDFFPLGGMWVLMALIPICQPCPYKWGCSLN